MKKIEINYSKYISDDRKEIADLFINAINNLTEEQSDFGNAIQAIVKYHETMSDSYSVISLSKDDIRNKGYNPNQLTDENMRNFAKEMHTDDLSESFWFALDSIAEEKQLPELRTEIDDLYNEWPFEPSYAIIWMEDRGYNNQPWKVTVKLTKDIEENQDIYMYFNGYNDLKAWLYSTLEEDSISEDCWCYDSLEHRVLFF